MGVGGRGEWKWSAGFSGVEKESGTCGIIKLVGPAAVCDGDVREYRWSGATRVLVGQSWWVWTGNSCVDFTGASLDWTSVIL